jgi:hypothetical protein
MKERVDESAATTKAQPMAPVPKETDNQAEPEGRQRSIDSRESQRPQQREKEQVAGTFADEKWQDFGNRWDAIQSGFVDDPRRTVEQADRLVAEVIAHLSQMFTQERARLEAQWSKGGKAETEDLRVAMQRYREFFKTLIGH